VPALISRAIPLHIPPTLRDSHHRQLFVMTDIDPPSLSPQTESFAEEVSYPSDDPSSTASNSSNSIVTFYRPPTILTLLRTTAINLILPFINGVMLGFGEIFAHELAFQWGWRSARVRIFQKSADCRCSRDDDRRDRVLKYDRRD
jgi:Outer membrane protein TOM13